MKYLLTILSCLLSFSAMAQQSTIGGGGVGGINGKMNITNGTSIGQTISGAISITGSTAAHSKTISSNIAVMVSNGTGGADPFAFAGVGNFDRQFRVGYFGSGVPHLFYWDSVLLAWRSTMVIPDILQIGDPTHMEITNALGAMNFYVNGNQFWLTNGTGSAAAGEAVDNILETYNYAIHKHSAISFNTMTETNGGGGATFHRGPALGTGNMDSAHPYRTNFFMDADRTIRGAFTFIQPEGGAADGRSYVRGFWDKDKFAFPRFFLGDYTGTNRNFELPVGGGFEIYARSALHGTNVIALEAEYDETFGGVVLTFGGSGVARSGVLRAGDSNNRIDLLNAGDGFMHFHHATGYREYTGTAGSPVLQREVNTALGTRIGRLSTTIFTATNAITLLATNAAPTGVTVGTTAPDGWYVVTNSSGLRTYVPAWIDH